MTNTFRSWKPFFSFFFTFIFFAKLLPNRPCQVNFLVLKKERGEGGGGNQGNAQIFDVFSGYVRLCGKATPPEALNLCGPRAGATENKQCLLVIRTSLRT